MGHSSLAVSHTYLRGLEVSELEEEDMPIKGLPILVLQLAHVLILHFNSIYK
tara:strand:+ start:4578 stop:4733 length:156 start_codon:yes stop_codon:yes gene_type:complete